MSKHSSSPTNEETDALTLSSFFGRILTFRVAVFQIFWFIVLSSLIQLIIPFLTQSIVDTGITNQDVNFITIILIAYFTLIISSTLIDFVRQWILFHIGLNINLELTYAYAKSILSKKLSYFSDKNEGYFLERIFDTHRIENFLTSTTMSSFMAFLNLILFGIILLIYNAYIFLAFVIGTVILLFWIIIFLGKRRWIDESRFQVTSQSRSQLLEMVYGITDIRINNLTRQKLIDWDKIQRSILDVNLASLKLSYLQQGGANGINEGKNAIITFLSATAVISGDMTIGEMIAVQYIIGQLNSPVYQIVGFIQHLQDTKLSLNRLSHVITPEDHLPEVIESSQQPTKISFDVKEDIGLSNISFQIGDKKILDQVNLQIPYGAKIGVVGESGSGKTTLLKLMLNLIEETGGEKLIAGKPINHYDINTLSNNFGCVFQDSHVFADTLEYNITLQAAREEINYDRLRETLKICCLEPLIQELPDQLQTVIGVGGRPLSRGQKQRVILARSVYKKPNYLFLDEFTNSLDSLTRNQIIKNIYQEFSEQTVVSVVHKLQDLDFVDRIYLMQQGAIIEEGTHEELMELKTAYFQLYKSQNESLQF